MRSKIWYSLFIVCLSYWARAQDTAPTSLEEGGPEQHYALLKNFLSNQKNSALPDGIELAISAISPSAIKGYRHVYLQQLVQGYPLLHAVGSIHYQPNGQILAAQAQFEELDPGDYPSHSPLSNALQMLQKMTGKELSLQPRNSFNKGIHFLQIQGETLALQQVYKKNPEGEVEPYYTCLLPEGGLFYRYWFHGITLEIIEKSQAGHQCSFHALENPRPSLGGLPFNAQEAQPWDLTVPSNGQPLGLYKAIPYPHENPLESNIQIVEEPLNPYSPYGWHDGNGAIGSLFDISRGNNVHAYADRQNVGPPQGTEPQNEDRNFTNIFSDWNSEPEELVDFHTLQMFYAVNHLHDVSASVGFDEESGNFQLFNYSELGAAGDEVRARVQLDAQNKNTLNTAFFATDIDGIKGQLAVSLFQTGRNAFLSADLQNFGDYKASITLPTFGPPLEGTLTGKLALGKTGEDLEGTFLGCKTLVNLDELQGSIALIDRGDCQFRDKVRRAQDAGAIAAIVCNFEDALINMGGGGTLPAPTIPSAMASSSACREFKVRMQQGEEIVVSLVKPQYQGPAHLDGSLDNGVIAHEYMHGITDRLVGGRMNAFCLLNAESMTEGWSDFLSMAMTIKEGDTPQKPRSIAAFLSQQDLSGQGIRRFPYSSDPALPNPLGYKDITGAGTIHQIGEIWASILWDVFWVFLDKYGIESSYSDSQSGNYKGLLLVVEALKLTPCNPGFTDTRDALLLADQLLFEGEHKCDLWEVFARRGLGVFADQGLTSDKDDGLANFSIPPYCSFPLHVEKTMPELIGQDENNRVSIYLLNNSSRLEGALLLDSLPPGYSIGGLQPPLPFHLSQDLLSIPLPPLNPGEDLNLSYTLIPGPESPTSKRLAFDPAESPNPAWTVNNLNGDYPWEIDTATPYQGNGSWTVYYAFGSSLQDLIWKPVLGETSQKPLLSYFQKFDTPPGISGGFISLEQTGEIQELPEDKILRGKYPRRMNPRVFSRNFIDAYSGQQNQYHRVLVDLSDYQLQDLGIRWRYGALNTSSFFPNPAWNLDNLEILDAVYYDLGCKIIDAQNQLLVELNKSTHGGSLVDTLLPTRSQEKVAEGEEFILYPNPANHKVNLHFPGAKSEHQSLELWDLQGRPLWRQNLPFPTEGYTLKVDHLAPGLYLIHYFNGITTSVKKLWIP
jgi:extracellular elastinolytic metalloproteinase